MLKGRSINELSYSETVEKVIELNEHCRDFWSAAHGWASLEAANLLSHSRLDWLASLSYSLSNWERTPRQEAQSGNLILAWGNIGALVEGNMKFFLSVYKTDFNSIKQRGKQIDPDGVCLPA